MTKFSKKKQNKTKLNKQTKTKQKQNKKQNENLIDTCGDFIKKYTVFTLVQKFFGQKYKFLTNFSKIQLLAKKFTI